MVIKYYHGNYYNHHNTSILTLQIGLAVDDIKGILEAAALTRLALRVCMSFLALKAGNMQSSSSPGSS